MTYPRPIATVLGAIVIIAAGLILAPARLYGTPASPPRAQGRAAPVTSSEWALAGDNSTRADAFMPAGRSVFAFRFTGSSDFDVRLLDAAGEMVAPLAAGRGPGRTEVAVDVATSGTYIVDVKAQGTWELRVWLDESGGADTHH